MMKGDWHESTLRQYELEVDAQEARQDQLENLIHLGYTEEDAEDFKETEYET